MNLKAIAISRFDLCVVHTTTVVAVVEELARATTSIRKIRSRRWIKTTAMPSCPYDKYVAQQPPLGYFHE
jgi:hypothetical protein